LISPISIFEPDWEAHLLPVLLTKEQVRKSPDIDTEKPVTRQVETQYYGYYGYPYYWGGAGMWGGGFYPDQMEPGYTNSGASRLSREREEYEYADAERQRHSHDDPHLRSCKAVTGYHVHATDGSIGHVDEFIVDEETWAIRYVVVNTSNWWVGHKVLMSPQWISKVNWVDRSISVDLTRESLKTAPPYDSAAELNRQSESALYEYYGRPGYWGSAALVSAV
jgi:hypothetical protein